MSLCLPRIAAGAAGASPFRIARGPVGMNPYPFGPSEGVDGDSVPLRSVLPADARSGPVRRCDSSTSLARFSRAIFSRCAFDRNLGCRRRYQHYYPIQYSPNNPAMNLRLRDQEAGLLKDVPWQLPHRRPSSSGPYRQRSEAQPLDASRPIRPSFSSPAVERAVHLLAAGEARTHLGAAEGRRSPQEEAEVV